MAQPPTTPEQRTFSLWDNAALWAAIGVSLYIMPFGSLLVPALSIERAMMAAAVAAFVGGLLLAGMAAIGARTGLSTVGLLESLFGRRAGKAAALLVLARNVAVGALVLSVIADAAALVSERALGAGLRPLWAVLFGLLALVLALIGPEFVVRKALRRGGVWVMLVLAVVITLSAYMEFEVPAYLKRPAVGGWPEFWQAVDIMLVVPLLWLPLAADYGRFGRSVTSTMGGSFLGFFVFTAWFGFLGIVYLPATESGDIAGFVVGMNMSLGALILLFLLQADEAFANFYSGGLALRAVAPVDGRIATGVAAWVAIILAATFNFLDIEGSILVLASVFIPLAGVMMAEQVLSRAAGRGGGAAPALLAWVLGFLLYHWISPPDARWWRDATEWLFADTLGFRYPLSDQTTWLGAAIPSFLAGFALHVAGSAVRAAMRGMSRVAASEQ